VHRARHPRHEARGVRLVVVDNGSGIPLEVRGKIFDAFFTTKRDVGTGLGLWVTRSLVDKHGGTLRMRTSTQGATEPRFPFSSPAANTTVMPRKPAIRPAFLNPRKI
jgi:signal transduction histidine kinase